MNQISVRGKLVNKNDVLANPERFKEAKIIIFEFANDEHYEVAKQFHKEWKKQIHRSLMLSIAFQDESFEKRASNLFFAMRDQICKHMGDTSRANKDSVYHGLLLDCDFRHVDGRPKESIKDLDKQELWELVQRAERELSDTEYTYEYTANINDLARDYTGQ